MNKTIRIFAGVLALILVVGMLPAASAATMTVAPGGTTTVSFAVDGAYGLDGSFSFSDTSFITGVSYSDNGAMDGSVSGGSAFYYGASSSALVIYVTVQVSPDALDGQICQITFTYETSDENGEMSSWKSSTCTVEVHIPSPVETEEPTEPPVNPPVPPATRPGGSEEPTEAPTEAPTEPAPTEEEDEPVAPTSPNVPEGPGNQSSVDYTELNRQISLAENLNQEQYTAESWAVFAEALEEAWNAKKSTSQSRVDNAARALKSARDALVVLDSAKLEVAMEQAVALLERDKTSEMWLTLRIALQNAIEQSETGDQSALDEAYAMLNAAIQKMEEVLAEQDAQVKEVTKEVFVEVEPKGDYCNIGSHHVWPIAFFVSLVLNLVFAGLVAAYFIRRKKNQVDDTPMVDYDIDDDFE